MSQSFVIWDDHTHSTDRHNCHVSAGQVIFTLLKEGKGKVFPVVAFVATDDTKYAKQDRLGYWWVFSSKPVEGAEYAFVDSTDEYSHKTRTGWWTGKLYQLDAN